MLVATGMVLPVNILTPNERNKTHHVGETRLGFLTINVIILYNIHNVKCQRYLF